MNCLPDSCQEIRKLIMDLEERERSSVIYIQQAIFKLLPPEGNTSQSFELFSSSSFIYGCLTEHLCFFQQCSASHSHGYAHLGAVRETAASHRWPLRAVQQHCSYYWNAPVEQLEVAQGHFNIVKEHYYLVHFCCYPTWLKYYLKMWHCKVLFPAGCRVTLSGINWRVFGWRM